MTGGREYAGADWSAFDDRPESTCACRCGRYYRSHVHASFDPPSLLSRRACGCGATNPLGIVGDPEAFSIGRT